MKKAIIIYQSKKGTTQQLGSTINQYLKRKGISTEIKSAEKITEKNLSSFDYIFLGCWTKGLMIIAQHPDKSWEKCIKSLEIPAKSKIFLFATYKIAIGSMFSKMRKKLPPQNQTSLLNIKSRNGNLPGEYPFLLDQYIN
ncbi:MAG: flavodoxin family protein [Bacteroidales bacterium]|jgi:flavodoxin|nr:flavodoxin family protein [Bacteroidales bacterium]